MTGNGTDQVDGIEYDAGPSVIDDSYPVNIAPLTIRRRRRQYANQRGRKWLNLLLPSRRQFTRSKVLLPQTWGKIAGPGVIAPNSAVVLTPEVARIMIATLVVAFLILLVVPAFALTIALVFGKEAKGRHWTDRKQGDQELPPIHVSQSCTW